MEQEKDDCVWHMYEMRMGPTSEEAEDYSYT